MEEKVKLQKITCSILFLVQEKGAPVLFHLVLIPPKRQVVRLGKCRHLAKGFENQVYIVGINDVVGQPQ